VKDPHLHFTIEIAGSLFTAATGDQGERHRQCRGPSHNTERRVLHQHLAKKGGIHEGSYGMTAEKSAASQR
jgi:hypothetical protein